MKFNIINTVYITLVHVGAICSIIFYKPMFKTIIGCFVFYITSGIGVTGGMHRLWAHKSYRANFLYRFIMMIMASIANQGTIFHWVRDHRLHHKYTDTDGDPHNSTRGFWFSHVGWLLVKKHPHVIALGRSIYMDDITILPEIKLQRKFDPFWNIMWCFGFPTFIGVYFWNEDPMTAFMYMGVFRYVLVLNFTWLVNSAAHMYGTHPYNTNYSAAENPMVALVSMGEGWHNWHHLYPRDYSASEFGISKQFNPTKLFIDCAAWMGLVSDRRRSLDLWNKRKEHVL